jgi:hypothetical protein
MMMGGAEQQPTAEDIFRQGFTEMSYETLRRSNPELLNDVITFRVIEVDPNRGMGVGAFVLSHNEEIFYIPAVISDNNLKPLDIVYNRTQDRYFPLNKEWLQESTKGTLGQMGAAVKPPQTMQTDVDIRQLVVPPTTGRYSYAEDTTAGAAWAIASALKDDKHEKRAFMLPALMSHVPDYVKLAFARFFQKNEKLGHALVECYGRSTVRQMMQPTPKQAELRLETPADKNVYILNAATPIQDLRKITGNDAARAYSVIRQHGFYVKDTRKDTNSLVELATTDAGLTEPTEPGMYRLFMTDGKQEEVFVIPGPKSLREQRSDEQIVRDSYFHTETNRGQGRQARKNYLIIFKDGRYSMTKDLIVEPLPSASHGTVEEHLRPLLANAPRQGETGCFISTAQVTIKATDPMEASKVTTTPEETHVTSPWGETVILSKKMGGNAIIKPVNSHVTTLPAPFQWCRLGANVRDTDYFHSVTDVLRAAEVKLLQQGAKTVSIKQAGHRFQINGGGSLPFTQAVEKLARDYSFAVPDAAEAIKMALDNKPHRIFSVPGLLKVAAKEEAPPEQPPMDPNAMAAMQAPPPPTGIDLAIAEQLQQIQMQMQALQDKSQALQMVQQRAQQIDMGGGAIAAPMGAAALQGGPATPVAGMPDPSMMGGQPGMPPQGQPGMPPQMGGQPGMSPMGGPPGMPPQGQPGVGGQPGMNGQPGMSMDPSMGVQGAAVPPMDMGQQAPLTPSLNDGQLDANRLEEQLNPDFLGQAEALNDDQVFDAAAVASIVQMKNLSELATAYRPNLEKALDNLGRLRLQFSIKEPEFKKLIGNDEYTHTEQNLKSVFQSLGDAILDISRATSFAATPMS